MSINFQGDSRPFASLEAEFKVAGDAAIDACRRLSPPYRPTVWIGMIANLGAAEAARRLVVSGDIQTGFGRLVQAGRPELTIEWEILSQQWDPLFSNQHREAALAGVSAKPASSRHDDHLNAAEADLGVFRGGGIA